MKRVCVRSVQAGLVLVWCLVWPWLHDWLVREGLGKEFGWLVGIVLMVWIGETCQRLTAPELTDRDPARSPGDRDW